MFGAKKARQWQASGVGIIVKAFLESISTDDFAELDRYVRDNFQPPGGGTLSGVDELASQIDRARGTRFSSIGRLAGSVRADAPAENRVALALARVFQVDDAQNRLLGRVASVMIAHDMIRRDTIPELHEFTGMRPSEVNRTVNANRRTPEDGARPALDDDERALIRESARVAGLPGDAVLDSIEKSSARSDRADTASDTVERLADLDSGSDMEIDEEVDPVRQGTSFRQDLRASSGDYATVTVDQLGPVSEYEQIETALDGGAALFPDQPALGAVASATEVMRDASPESRRAFLEEGKVTQELSDSVEKKTEEKKDPDQRSDPEHDHHGPGHHGPATRDAQA